MTHERKRQVEVQLLLLEQNLREKGLGEDKIKYIIDEDREKKY